MITIEDFMSLSPDDCVETVPLYAGLSEEPLLLVVTGSTVSSTSKRRKTLEFDATYFGIPVGKWTTTRKGEELEWSTPT